MEEYILPIILIIISGYLFFKTPSLFFNFNWKEKTSFEKIKMIIFYGIVVYFINLIFWLFD